MAGVNVKRNVVLRSIVTDELKKQLGEELQAAADEVSERVQQLEFSTKGYITDLQRADLQRAMQVRKQVEAEKAKQTELRDMLLERKAQVGTLENGEEIVRGTLESFVEVNMGDDLGVLLGGVEIVTKDEVIVEIRQHKPEEGGARPALVTKPEVKLAE